MTTAPSVTQLHKALDQEQIDQFRRRGFIIIGKLLDDDLVAVLRDEYDRLFAEARQNGRFRNLSISNTDDLDEKNSADEQMLQIMQMCERSIHFRQLLYDTRILDIAEDLIGPNIQLFHDQALYKPAHHGGPVFWHQDNAYWKCMPANLVSCWMTLDDVDVTNGAMHLLPELAPDTRRTRALGADQCLARLRRPSRCNPSRGHRPTRRRRTLPPLPNPPLHPTKPNRSSTPRLCHPLHAPWHALGTHRAIPRSVFWPTHAADAGLITAVRVRPNSARGFPRPRPAGYRHRRLWQKAGTGMHRRAPVSADR